MSWSIICCTCFRYCPKTHKRPINLPKSPIEYSTASKLFIQTFLQLYIISHPIIRLAQSFIYFKWTDQSIGSFPLPNCIYIPTNWPINLLTRQIKCLTASTQWQTVHSSQSLIALNCASNKRWYEIQIWKWIQCQFDSARYVCIFKLSRKG